MTEEEIAMRRKESGVSPVSGRTPPAWLTRKVREASRRLGFGKCTPYGSSQMIFRRFLDEVAIRSDICDHCGRTKVDGKSCFVLEPYPRGDKREYEDMLETTSRLLSEALDCKVTWSRASWHYPGWTYRILFSEE